MFDSTFIFFSDFYALLKNVTELYAEAIFL